MKIEKRFYTVGVDFNLRGGVSGSRFCGFGQFSGRFYGFGWKFVRFFAVFRFLNMLRFTVFSKILVAVYGFSSKLSAVLRFLSAFFISYLFFFILLLNLIFSFSSLSISLFFSVIFCLHDLYKSMEVNWSERKISSNYH